MLQVLDDFNLDQTIDNYIEKVIELAESQHPLIWTTIGEMKMLLEFKKIKNEGR